jgi:CRP-like cAMP-binding protein
MSAATILANISLFTELDASELDELSGVAGRRTYQTDQTVVRQGELTDEFYVVVNGLLQVSVRDEGGREIILNLLHAGDAFGELAVLDGQPRSATITARNPCVLLVFAGVDLRAMLTRSPTMSLKLMRSLARTVRRLTDRAGDLSFHPIPVRLAKVLLEIADFCGTRLASNQIALPIGFSQQDYAGHVQATRESVNKCLATWIRDQVVYQGESQLIILDRRCLEEIAAGQAGS